MVLEPLDGSDGAHNPKVGHSTFQGHLFVHQMVVKK
jgi:hypothetical protein